MEKEEKNMRNNNKNYNNFLKCSIKNIIVMTFIGLIFSTGINAQSSYYNNNLSLSSFLDYNLYTNYPYNNISSFLSNNYFNTYNTYRSFQYQSPFFKDQYWNPGSFYPNSLYNGSLFHQNDFYSGSLYTTSVFPSSTFSGLSFSGSLSPQSLLPELIYHPILFPELVYPFTPSQKPKQSETSTPSSTEEVPEWLLKKIGFTRLAYVAIYVYKGEPVYYLPPPSGIWDSPSSVYNFEGTFICSPDGGVTGYGNGGCPDFFSEGQKIRTIPNVSELCKEYLYEKQLESKNSQ